MTTPRQGTVTFEAPQVNKTTTFAFTLTATAGTDSASGLVTVTVIDDAPGPAGLAVHAEARHDAYEGDSVTLSGTAAGVPSSALTYMWAQTSPASPQASLGDAASRTTTFEAPQVDETTAFAFTLTATDGTDSVSDSVRVVVLDAPAGAAGLAVHAESSNAAREGDPVTLSGTAAGVPSSALTYMWAQTSPASPQASLGDAASRTVMFTAPQVDGATAFEFTLTATDGNRTASDVARVTILDAAAGPGVLTVHAEAHHAAYEGDRISLSGSAAGAPPGSVAYRWAQASPESPQASLGDATAPTVTFDAPPVDRETIFTFHPERHGGEPFCHRPGDSHGPGRLGSGSPGYGRPGYGRPGYGPIPDRHEGPALRAAAGNHHRLGRLPELGGPGKRV